MKILNNQKFQTIKTDYKNYWLYIWLNRPESKNALSKKMIIRYQQKNIVI